MSLPAARRAATNFLRMRVSGARRLPLQPAQLLIYRSLLGPRLYCEFG
jgi:hypothetical protein